PEIDGVTPEKAKTRINRDRRDRPYSPQPMAHKHMRLDPQHDTEFVLRQLQGDNAGFVFDFHTRYKWKSRNADRHQIMDYYRVDFLPALHTLAREFTICDRWFSSLPGPTWPN